MSNWRCHMVLDQEICDAGDKANSSIFLTRHSIVPKWNCQPLPLEKNSSNRICKPNSTSVEG